MFYSHKKNMEMGSKTIPSPYVKIDDVTNVRQSLDFNQWKNIIELYFDKIKNHLFEGNRFDVPNKLGTLLVTTAKCEKIVDRVKCNVEKKTVYTKPSVLNDGGMVFKLKWDVRYKKCALTNRHLWKTMFVRDEIKRYYKEHDKDFTFVNRFENTTFK